jgi:enoyl-CoA hydratase
VGYKRLIDSGFGMPFADAMAMESRVAGENAASVTPATIAGRRDVVRNRGRSQAAD